MKIELSTKELKELLNAPCVEQKSSGDSLKGGWVSHPVATDNPPCVTTTATTAAKDGDPSEPDWMKANWPESEIRANAVGSQIIRDLLDFEGWLDTVLADDKDIGRIRFHYEPVCDDELLRLFATVEFKNADRRKTPREFFHIATREIPEDDEKLADFEAESVEWCILWGCSYRGLSHEDYLKWLETPKSEDHGKQEE